MDKLKTFESCTLTDKYKKLTARYLALMKQHHPPWSSPKARMIHQVNDAIRAALNEDKLIGEAENLVRAFQPVDLTNAQKRDVRSYSPDTVLVFNRDVRGFKAGESARLKQITSTHLMVATDTREVSIPFKHLDRLTVCQSRGMAMAADHRLKRKANGRSVENCKLVDGDLVTVEAIHPDRRIALKGGRVLDKTSASLFGATPSPPGGSLPKLPVLSTG